MIQLGVVRFYMKDLMSYWPTDVGILGLQQVEGDFIALMLRGSPQIVRVGFNSPEERDQALRRLDKLKKRKR